MRLVFAGTPEPAATALNALLNSGHEVVGVITRPDTVAGRGRKATRSAVGALADEHGIEVWTPTTLRGEDAERKIEQWAPDCVPVVAYGGLVPANLLTVPEHGWINLHFSLLPAHRGAAPVQASIAAGDDLTGASTFRIDQGLDTGPVFGVVTEPIHGTDTAGQLLDRLAVSGSRLLVSTLDAIAAQSISAVPQDHSAATAAPKIDVADAQIRWDLPAHVIDRRIRAHTPAPGAWTKWLDARLKLGPLTALRPGSGDAAPGTVHATKKEVTVATADGVVVLGTVQPPGKKPMNAADWARGARLAEQTEAVVFG